MSTVIDNSISGVEQDNSSGSVSAFGEQSVAELTSIVNVQFPYNIHHDLLEERHNNGSASVANSMVALSTGAVASQMASLLTRVPIKYYSGIGGLVRFTTIYTAGVAGSNQYHGVGDSGDGYFFGYQGADFGVLRRFGGNPEIRTIQVTTKSTTAENITITLDGDVDATVTVTDATAGDATTTANDIAAHDFSGLGSGWTARAEGDKVYFHSFNSTPRTGSYTLSGATTAVGTQAQVLAGVVPDDTDFTTLTNFSEGAPTGFDPTKGNVYQIRYQWLGFGQITFYIENNATGRFEPAHKIKYTNENITPSVYNPTLPICLMCQNTTNDTDIVVKSSSMAGFIEGKKPEAVVKHVHIIDKTFSSTTIVPAITLLNDELFQSKLNRVRIKITKISVEVQSGKPVIIQLVRNAILTGAVFTAHDADESVTLVDTTASATENGEILDAGTVTTDAERTPNQYVEVEQTMTIAGAQASSGTASVCKIIVNWEEDF